MHSTRYVKLNAFTVLLIIGLAISISISYFGVYQYSKLLDTAREQNGLLIEQHQQIGALKGLLERAGIEVDERVMWR